MNLQTELELKLSRIEEALKNTEDKKVIEVLSRYWWKIYFELEAISEKAAA